MYNDDMDRNVGSILVLQNIINYVSQIMFVEISFFLSDPAG